MVHSRRTEPQFSSTPEIVDLFLSLDCPKIISSPEPTVSLVTTVCRCIMWSGGRKTPYYDEKFPNDDDDQPMIQLEDKNIYLEDTKWVFYQMPHIYFYSLGRRILSLAR